MKQFFVIGRLKCIIGEKELKKKFLAHHLMDHSVTYKKIEESASQFPKYSRKKVHHYLVVTTVEIIIRYIIQILIL